MASYDLTQSEADSLHRLDKRRIDDKEWVYPGMGGRLSIPLVSRDGKEPFILDIRRGRANLAKGSYQNRARRTIVLVRLCFGGNPHVNPDGQSVGSPHIHTYREGYADKWASILPGNVFINAADRRRTFDDFLSFCNVIDPPQNEFGAHDLQVRQM